MLAKTMYGLEDILHQELEELGARDIVPGRRMVAFKETESSSTEQTSFSEDSAPHIGAGAQFERLTDAEARFINTCTTVWTGVCT